MIRRELRTDRQQLQTKGIHKSVKIDETAAMADARPADRQPTVSESLARSNFDGTVKSHICRFNVIPANAGTY
jgi:hypothetical protein